MIEMKLKGSIQYIGDKYYELVCKIATGKYVLVRVIGLCPYTMEQHVTLDCNFMDVEIIGNYYELVVKEEK